jgi:hypothetical protein
VRIFVVQYAIGNTDAPIAKHLDQLKGGRFPLEVLVRGKDAEENEKLFVKITDIIKEAGVSLSAVYDGKHVTHIYNHRKKSVS